MPTCIGRFPSNSFKYLLDKIWKRVNAWSDRPMSRAGKEVMLKAVIQVIPTYTMSCFQIPVAICDSIRKIIADQW